MNPGALDHWRRAQQALRSAELLAAAGDHDGAASRAYYAAFHALSALFESEGRTFTKHGQIEGALHRDLIREGRLDTSVGKSYSTLREYRTRGDYGGLQHVSPAAAALAIACANDVVRAVRAVKPELDASGS